MRKVLRNVVGAYLVLAVAGVILAISGIYDVAATSPHWPVTTWVLEKARMQSIKTQAADIKAPSGLFEPARIALGTEHFAAHCAVCHGAPGVPPGDIADGLYPRPPDLAGAATKYTASELFWIVKHGIKMTGMPSWSDHTDEELWATVGFIEKLPGMTKQQYGELVKESMKMGGRHNHGGTEAPASTDPSGGHSTMPGMNMNGMDMKGMDMHGGATPHTGDKPASSESPVPDGADHHSH